MQISLIPAAHKFLKDRMRRGGYTTPEDAVIAALVALQQQEHQGDFAPGELDELLAVADAEIERGELLDGEDVFRELRGLGSEAGNKGE